MARIELRVLIRATPDDVWPVIADFEAQKDWMVDVSKLAITSEAKSGIGTTLEVTSRLFGLPVVKDVMEVDSWDPPRSYTVVHKGQFSGRGAFILEPVPGGTVFTWWEDFEAPLRVIGEIGFGAAVGPHLRKVFARSMDNVRRLAEARAASRTAG